MKSFSDWMKIKEGVYDKFNGQAAASVAQAVAGAGDNPNVNQVAKNVVNDPKLKQVTPPGVKPDEQDIKNKIQNSILNRQKELKNAEKSQK